jgi:hypothetical protein
MKNGMLMRRPKSKVRFFDELDDVIYAKVRNFQNDAFSVKLISGEVDGVEDTFTFAHYAHFHNWFNLIMNGQPTQLQSTYQGNAVVFRDTLRSNNKHVFRKLLNVSDNIKPVVDLFTFSHCTIRNQKIIIAA